MKKNIKNTNASYLITGQIGHHAFKAEIHPEQHTILILANDKNEVLPNQQTEQRIQYVAARLTLLHRLFFLLKLWHIVEVQTCFDDVRLAKITGQRSGGGWWAVYNRLTAKELEVVSSLLPKT
jgi:hypothetical protein